MAEQRTDARVRIFNFHDDPSSRPSGDSAWQRLFQLHRLGRSFYDDIFRGVKQLQGLSPRSLEKLRRLPAGFERAGSQRRLPRCASNPRCLAPPSSISDVLKESQPVDCFVALNQEA